MDQPRLAEMLLQVQHRHRDGTWSDLEPRPGHDPAERDPERSWGQSQLYACPVCDEEFLVKSRTDRQPA